MRIDRYLFRQLLIALIVVTVSLACVMWLSQSLRYIEMVVGRGLSAGMFFYFTMLLLPTLLAVVIPIAMFVAVLFIYSKLTADSELVVMRALGFSQLKLARPALILAVLCTAASYLLALWLMPASYRAFKDLQHTIKTAYSSVLIQEGVFNPLLVGVTVYVRSRTFDGELLGIIVHDDRVPARPVTMMAERGVLVSGPTGPRVVMTNGNRQEIDTSGHLSLLYFDRYTFDIDIASESAYRGGRGASELFIGELLNPPETVEPDNRRRWYVEAHQRLATPLLCLGLAAVALSLLLSGDFNRRGQTVRIVAAVLIGVAMEALLLGVKNIGINTPAVVPAMYLVPLLPAAVGLYRLAGHPRGRRMAPSPAGAA